MDKVITDEEDRVVDEEKKGPKKHLYNVLIPSGRSKSLNQSNRRSPMPKLINPNVRLFAHLGGVIIRGEDNL